MQVKCAQVRWRHDPWASRAPLLLSIGGPQVLLGSSFCVTWPRGRRRAAATRWLACAPHPQPTSLPLLLCHPNPISTPSHPPVDYLQSEGFNLLIMNSHVDTFLLCLNRKNVFIAGLILMAPTNLWPTFIHGCFGTPSVHFSCTGTLQI